MKVRPKRAAARRSIRPTYRVVRRWATVITMRTRAWVIGDGKRRTNAATKGGPAASIMRPMMLLPLTCSPSFSTRTEKPSLARASASRRWMERSSSTMSAVGLLCKIMFMRASPLVAESFSCP